MYTYFYLYLLLSVIARSSGFPVLVSEGRDLRGGAKILGTILSDRIMEEVT